MSFLSIEILLVGKYNFTMPGTSRQKNPRGVEIVFTESNHRYSSIINGKELVYVSGTKFIHPFFPPFDPDGTILKKSAEKKGMKPEDLKKEWEKAGRDSCIFGTKVHETIEDKLLGNEFRQRPQDNREIQTFKAAISIAEKIQRVCNVKGIEQIVFDERLRIAGTIDLLAESKDGKETWIIDHKTNKVIEFENKWNKFALDPISHLPDLNSTHYGLQLSLYEYLLKSAGYIPRDRPVRRFVNHVSLDSAKFYELPDYSTEIRDMIIFTLMKNSQVQGL